MAKELSRVIKSKAYSSIVRPKLEYAAFVWDPYTDINIYDLEAVQRRAAHFVCNIYSQDASVSLLLTQLQWPRLAMLHRILSGTVDIACDSLVAKLTKPSRFRYITFPLLRFIIFYRTGIQTHKHTHTYIEGTLHDHQIIMMST